MLFEPRPGFKTQFNIKSDDRDFPHLWQVLEVIPEKELLINWKYAGFTGDSVVKFELLDEKESTILRLSQHILGDFPDNIPEFKRESCVAGWDYFIKKSLKDFLG